VKGKALPYVLEQFRTPERDADIVLVEGAGSASEVNLRQYDIANMGFARAASVGVLNGAISPAAASSPAWSAQGGLDPDDAA